MESNIQHAPVSKKRLWAGRIISWLPALFLLLDGIMKLVKPAPVVEATVRLGYSENVIVPLGIVLLVCTFLYLITRTSVLGAILLTGYLGGAVATHVRAGEEIFSIGFPIIFGALLCTAQTVDDYLAALPEEARATLEKIRKTIKAVAPSATEVISYQIPMYKHHGMLVGFAAFKDHCSFFPGAKAMVTYKDELKAYKTSKGTIRFPIGKPLPAALVKKLVKTRIAENEAALNRKERR